MGVYVASQTRQPLGQLKGEHVGRVVLSTIQMHHAARQGVHGPIRRFDFKFFIAVYGAAAGLDIAGLQASALRFAKKLAGWGVGVELAAVPIEQNKPQARNVHGLKHEVEHASGLAEECFFAYFQGQTVGQKGNEG